MSAQSSSTQTSPDLYRQLFYSHPHALFLCQANNLHIIQVNRFATQLFSCSQRDLLKKKITSLWSQNSDKFFQDIIPKPSNSPGLNCTFSLEAKTLTGKKFWAEVFLTPITVQNTPACILVSIKDITRQRAIEKQLLVKEKQLEKAFENSPLPTFILNQNHRVVVWNKALEQLTGFQHSQVINTQNAWKAFYPKKRPVLADLVLSGSNKDIIKYYHRSQVKESPQKKGIFHIISHLRLQNQPKTIFFTAAAIKDHTGQAIMAVETLLDLTKEKQAERELLESEEKFHTIFENSAVAITMVDNKERIVSWNSFAQKLLKMSKKDLHLKPVKLLYPKEEWKKIREENIRQKGIHHHFQTKMKKKDKTIIDVDISISILKNKSGKVVGSIGVFRDVTKEKIAQEKLTRQIELLERFKASTVDLALEMKKVEAKNRQLTQQLKNKAAT